MIMIITISNSDNELTFFLQAESGGMVLSWPHSPITPVPKGARPSNVCLCNKIPPQLTLLASQPLQLRIESPKHPIEKMTLSWHWAPLRPLRNWVFIRY